MNSEWRLVTGSVAGLDHAQRAGGCEDSFAVAEADGALILAVADGGSRLRLSSVGSSLAAALAVHRARAALDGAGPGIPADATGWHGWMADLMAGIFAAFGQLTEHIAAAVPDGAPRDLGTTLTLAVIASPWLAVASVGDGFVVTRCGTDHLDLLLPPDWGATSAEVIGAEPSHTTFITSPGAASAARVAVARIPDLTGVAVSTDGLRELSLVYASALAQYPHDGFFQPVFTRADAGEDTTVLLRLLSSERVCELTTDDKTMIVAVRR